MKKKLSHYLVELSIVFIGVTVAFWFNGIEDKIKMNRTKKHIWENIVLEVGHNHNKLSKIVHFQDSLLEVYNGDSARFDGLNLKKLVLHDSGYEMARSTGVLSEMEFEKANQVTLCYNLQGEIREIESKFIDLVLFEEKPDLEKIMSILTQLNGLEKSLVEVYDKLLVLDKEEV